MRVETVDIEPTELCADCPNAGTCEGVAVRALDTYIKATFFSLRDEIPGDPDVKMFRQFVDQNSGTSEEFLTDGEEVRACEGPITVKKRLFKKNDVVCGAQNAVVNEVHARTEERRRKLELEYAQKPSLTPPGSCGTS